MHRTKLKAIKYLLLEYRDVIDSRISSEISFNKVAKLPKRSLFYKHQIKIRNRINRGIKNIKTELEK